MPGRITKKEYAQAKAIFAAIRAMTNAVDSLQDELLTMTGCEHNGCLYEACYSGNRTLKQALDQEGVEIL